jgi:hypothetical protein
MAEGSINNSNYSMAMHEAKIVVSLRRDRKPDKIENQTRSKTKTRSKRKTRSKTRARNPMGRMIRTMTQMEVVYRYGAVPGEAEMRAIDNLRDVYGIRRITFNDRERTVRIEFDASRFKEPVLASLLRRAGIDVQEKLVLA